MRARHGGESGQAGRGGLEQTCKDIGWRYRTLSERSGYAAATRAMPPAEAAFAFQAGNQTAASRREPPSSGSSLPARTRLLYGPRCFQAGPLLRTLPERGGCCRLLATHDFNGLVTKLHGPQILECRFDSGLDLQTYPLTILVFVNSQMKMFLSFSILCGMCRVMEV